MILPQMDDDDEEMEIIEDSDARVNTHTDVIMKEEASDADVNMKEDTLDYSNESTANFLEKEQECENHISTNDLKVVPSEISIVLKSPTPTVSPRITCSTRKSLRTSSTLNEKTSSVFAETDRLAASLHHGLEVIDKHRKSCALGRSSFRFSYKPIKKDVGVQTSSQENELAGEKTVVFLYSNCTGISSEIDKDESNLQLVPVDDESQLVPVDDGSQLVVDKSRHIVPKVVEKVLAGAIRREMALEEFCRRQNSEMMQLNRLVQQYKHERECSLIIGKLQEDKIARLENLMDGVLSAEEFVDEELTSLRNEHEILQEKYENHPEILAKEIELRNVQEELERYKNFYDLGERDVLMEEIQDLRTQLQVYVDSSPNLLQKNNPVLQITYPCEPNGAPSLSTVQEPTVESAESAMESAERRFESERIRFAEAESKWISTVEELKSQLEANRLITEKQKQELDSEKMCSDELKEALQLAMEGHARMLEQYADLEERHMNMLIRHRRIQDGIEDVKKAAAVRGGVRGAESKFINALAAEISALKVEREKERRHFRDENKGLQAQLNDTAEAVQAAGELLVRLKEAEEAVAAAEARARDAEQETENAYKQIERLKKKQKKNDESSMPIYNNIPIYDTEESNFGVDHVGPYSEEEELTILPEPSSWFSGYDRCNI